LYFFFFQAEDGIRDFHVTGVQTCALPILFGQPHAPAGRLSTMQDLLPHYERELAFLRRYGREFAERYPKIAGRLLVSADGSQDQIGRASCRGGVGMSGVAEDVEVVR